MRRTLRIHPESRGPAGMLIEAEAVRSGAGLLTLRYSATGPLSDVFMPQGTVPARGNELWQHTCFEAFVRAPSSAGYHEFNFAPSRQWAAYRFDGLRRGMRVAADIDVTDFEVRLDESLLEMKVSVELGGVLELPGNVPWRLGLSAVIEETSGSKSYWALAHPPGRPDFHHRDCFDLELPAA